MKLYFFSRIRAIALFFSLFFLPTGLVYAQNQRSSLDEFTAPQLSAPDAYVDLFSACSNIIFDLARTREEANLYGATSMKAANETMLRGLERAYNKIRRKYVAAGPHVSLAIMAGFSVAQTYRQNMENNQGRYYGPEMAYNRFINQIYDFIDYGYYNIDMPYYSSFQRVCLGSHYCFDVRFNPRNEFNSGYEDGMRQLALKMLNVLIYNAEETGRDRVELSLTATIAKNTNQLLNESVYRREFSCDVVGLWNVSQMAKQYLDGQFGQGLSSTTVVNMVRSKIFEVYRSIESKNSARCYGR